MAYSYDQIRSLQQAYNLDHIPSDTFARIMIKQTGNKEMWEAGLGTGFGKAVKATFSAKDAAMRATGIPDALSVWGGEVGMGPTARAALSMAPGALVDVGLASAAAAGAVAAAPVTAGSAGAAALATGVTGGVFGALAGGQYYKNTNSVPGALTMGIANAFAPAIGNMAGRGALNLAERMGMAVPISQGLTMAETMAGQLAPGARGVANEVATGLQGVPMATFMEGGQMLSKGAQNVMFAGDQIGSGLAMQAAEGVTAAVDAPWGEKLKAGFDATFDPESALLNAITQVGFAVPGLRKTLSSSPDAKFYNQYGKTLKDYMDTRYSAAPELTRNRTGDPAHYTLTEIGHKDVATLAREQAAAAQVDAQTGQRSKGFSNLSSMADALKGEAPQFSNLNSMSDHLIGSTGEGEFSNLAAMKRRLPVFDSKERAPESPHRAELTTVLQEKGLLKPEERAPAQVKDMTPDQKVEVLGNPWVTASAKLEIASDVLKVAPTKVAETVTQHTQQTGTPDVSSEVLTRMAKKKAEREGLTPTEVKRLDMNEMLDRMQKREREDDPKRHAEEMKLISDKTKLMGDRAVKALDVWADWVEVGNREGGMPELSKRLGALVRPESTWDSETNAGLWSVSGFDGGTPTVRQAGDKGKTHLFDAQEKADVWAEHMNSNEKDGRSWEVRETAKGSGKFQVVAKNKMLATMTDEIADRAAMPIDVGDPVEELITVDAAKDLDAAFRMIAPLERLQGIGPFKALSETEFNQFMQTFANHVAQQGLNGEEMMKAVPAFLSEWTNKRVVETGHYIVVTPDGEQLGTKIFKTEAEAQAHAKTLNDKHPNLPDFRRAASEAKFWSRLGDRIRFVFDTPGEATAHFERWYADQVGDEQMHAGSTRNEYLIDVSSILEMAQEEPPGHDLNFDMDSMQVSTSMASGYKESANKQFDALIKSGGYVSPQYVEGGKPTKANMMELATPTFMTQTEKMFSPGEVEKLPKSKTGGLFYDLVKARFKGLPKVEQDLLPGFLDWVEATGKENGGQIRPEAIVEYVKANGPQVNVHTYGMEGSDTVKAERDALSHEWLENLPVETRTLIEEYRYAVDDDSALNLGDPEDLYQQVLATGVDITKVQRWVELNAKITGKDLAGPKATSYYKTISPYDTDKYPVVRIDVALPTKQLSDAQKLAKYKEDARAGKRGKFTASELAEIEGIQDWARIPERIAEDPYQKPELWSPDNLHENLPNTLGWAMVQFVPGPDGRTVMFVGEQQSRWGQSRSKEEANYKKRVAAIEAEDLANKNLIPVEQDGQWYLVQPNEQPNLETDSPFTSRFAALQAKTRFMNVKAREPQTPGHPLLDSQHNLVLKAALDEARKRGVDQVVISDGTTAMMTEGHDKAVKQKWDVKDKDGKLVFAYDSEADAKTYALDPKRLDRGYVITKRDMQPDQSGGMRLHYDTTLPSAMRALTGDKGREVVMPGVHKNRQAPIFRIVKDKHGLFSSEYKVLMDVNQPGAGSESVGTFKTEQEAKDFKLEREKLAGSVAVFRNPDGTANTSIVGQLFDVSKVTARRATGESFSFGGKNYMLVGDKAILTPEQLAVKQAAMRMDASGTDPKRVTLLTGWFKSAADGEWRFQTSDRYLEIRPDLRPRGKEDWITVKELDELATKHGFDSLIVKEAVERVNEQNMRPMSLPDGVTVEQFLVAPELLSMYPFLRDIPVKRLLDVKGQEYRGYYAEGGPDPAKGGLLALKENMPYGEFVDVLVHEVQHYIQGVENWARGGNSSTKRSWLEFDLGRRLNETKEAKAIAEHQAKNKHVVQKHEQVVEDYKAGRVPERTYKASMRTFKVFEDKLERLVDALETVRLSDKFTPKDPTSREGLAFYKKIAGEIEANLASDSRMDDATDMKKAASLGTGMYALSNPKTFKGSLVYKGEDSQSWGVMGSQKFAVENMLLHALEMNGHTSEQAKSWMRAILQQFDHNDIQFGLLNDPKALGMQQTNPDGTMNVWAGVANNLMRDRHAFMFTMAHEVNGHGLIETFKLARERLAKDPKADIKGEFGLSREHFESVKNFYDMMAGETAESRGILVREFTSLLPVEARKAVEQLLVRPDAMKHEEAMADMQATMSYLIASDYVNGRSTGRLAQLIELLPTPIAKMFTALAEWSRKFFSSLRTVQVGRAAHVVDGYVDPVKQGILDDYLDSLHSILRVDARNNKAAVEALRYSDFVTPGAIGLKLAGPEVNPFLRRNMMESPDVERAVQILGLMPDDGPAPKKVGFFRRHAGLVSTLSVLYPKFGGVTAEHSKNEHSRNTVMADVFAEIGLRRKGMSYLADKDSAPQVVENNVVLAAVRDDLMRLVQVRMKKSPGITVAQLVAAGDAEALGYLGKVSKQQQSLVLDAVFASEKAHGKLLGHMKTLQDDIAQGQYAILMKALDRGLTVEQAKQRVKQFHKAWEAGQLGVISTGYPDVDAAMIKYFERVRKIHEEWSERRGYISEQRSGDFRYQLHFKDGTKSMDSALSELQMKINIDAHKLNPALDKIVILGKEPRNIRFQRQDLEALAEVESEHMYLLKSSIEQLADAHPELTPEVIKIITGLVDKSSTVSAQLASVDANTLDVKSPKARRLAPGRENLDMFGQQIMFFERVVKGLTNKLTKVNYDLAMRDEDMINHPASEMMDQAMENLFKPDPEMTRVVQNMNWYKGLFGNWFNMIQDASQPMTGLLRSVLVGKGVSVVDAERAIWRAGKDLLPGGKLTGERAAIVEWFKKGNVGLASTETPMNNDALMAIQERRRLMGYESSNLIKDNIVKPTFWLLQKSKDLAKIATDYGETTTMLASFDAFRKQGMNFEQAREAAFRNTKEVNSSSGKSGRSVTMWNAPALRPIAAMVNGLQNFSNGVIGILSAQLQRGFFSYGPNSTQFRKNLSNILGHTGELSKSERVQARKAFVIGMGTMLAVAGALGIPGVGIYLKTMEALGWNAKEDLMKALTDEEDPDNSTFNLIALHGLGNLLGFDVGAKMGVGGMLGLNPYNGFDAANLFGVTGGLIKSAGLSAVDLLHGNVGSAVERVAPNVLQRPLKLYRDGWEFRDADGTKMIESTDMERTMMSVFGVKPKRLMDMEELRRIQRADRDIRKQTNVMWVDEQATKLEGGDVQQVKEAIAERVSQDPTLEPDALMELIAQQYVDRTMPYNPALEPGARSPLMAMLPGGKGQGDNVERLQTANHVKLMLGGELPAYMRPKKPAGVRKSEEAQKRIEKNNLMMQMLGGAMPGYMGERIPTRGAQTTTPRNSLERATLFDQMLNANPRQSVDEISALLRQ